MEQEMERTRISVMKNATGDEPAKGGLDLISKPSSTRRLLRDLSFITGLGFVSVAIGGLLTWWVRGNGAWELWVICGFLSVGISIPSLFIIHSSWVREYPAAAPLLVIMWRMGSFMMVVFAQHATNWQADNFFLTCLLGCYFPFLLLESALFINQVRD